MFGPDAMFAVSGLLLFALPLAFYMLRDDDDEVGSISDPVADEMTARKQDQERRERRQKQRDDAEE